jgi:catechol 2,3-dioxygenase-like lactoylglutathione lyase family enzyme
MRSTEVKVTDTPILFRIVVQVSDLDKAADFYSQLLGLQGRNIRGSRHYFDCGPVILALVDPTPGGETAIALPDYLYFAVQDIEEFHRRAKELDCLSREEVHDESAGEIVTRPWGERSFYAQDPFGNGLCFVAENTVFTGRT